MHGGADLRAPGRAAAHRFLANTEAHLGHLDESLRQAALAVVSDPGYEAAWSTFRDVALATGRSYLRVYGDKTVVEPGPESSEGKPSITIELPRSALTAKPEPAGDEAPQKDASPASSDGSQWLIYGMQKALLMKPRSEHPCGEGHASPFQIERSAVESALESFSGAGVVLRQPKCAVLVDARPGPGCRLPG